MCVVRCVVKLILCDPQVCTALVQAVAVACEVVCNASREAPWLRKVLWRSATRVCALYALVSNSSCISL